MKFQRVLLAPLAWLYAGVLHIRHALYDLQLKKSTRPTIPTIVVGNLAFGGTGKTPHVELLLGILMDHDPLATLSRGYGRSGTKIREIGIDDDPRIAGDEPLQLKQKFPEVHVFVGADRIQGLQTIERTLPDVKAVVLDDALQHRRLNAGLNIILTTWQRPWYTDALLPAGRLRDVPARAKAAQIVIITKCPELPSAQHQQEWRGKLGLHSDQHLFFSSIEYGAIVPIETGEHSAELRPTSGASILLVTGIADPRPLVEHLRSTFSRVEHAAYPDHHAFTRIDIQKLAIRFDKFAPGPKLLITTEKDAVRLRPLLADGPLKGVPFGVLGMRAVILNEPQRFGALIKAHVGKDK